MNIGQVQSVGCGSVARPHFWVLLAVANFHHCHDHDKRCSMCTATCLGECWVHTGFTCYLPSCVWTGLSLATLHRCPQCHLCFSVMNDTTRHLQKAEPLLNSSAMSQCNTCYARGWRCITLPGVLRFTPLSNICLLFPSSHCVPSLLADSSSPHGYLEVLAELSSPLGLKKKLLYLLLYTFHNGTLVNHYSYQLVTTGRKPSINTAIFISLLWK